VLQSAAASGEARVSYPTVSQLPAKLKGPCPLSLCALSIGGETKIFYNAKSQASGEVKAFYNAKSPASGEVTILSSARPSAEVSALSGTKFTTFKAELASCEAISIL